MRTEILFNENWLFHKGDIAVTQSTYKGPVYEQSKTERKQMGPAAYKYFDTPDSWGADGDWRDDHWEFVQLPHDFVINQDNQPDENCALGYMHYDNAWYRKHFTLPENSENKRILLRFDGIAGQSVIYLNGCPVHHNFSAYNTFEIDISDIVFYDRDNVLAVYVNTEEFEGWWYQGGGIYRDVYLTVTEPIAIDLWGVYCPYKKISDTDWQIDFETTVVNDDYTVTTVTAQSTVFDANGQSVAAAFDTQMIPQRTKSAVKYSAVVNNPLLWSCETPNLYTVKTVLKNGETVLDETVTRIGFRTVEISVKDGFRINGKRMFINGVCCHQDYGLTGIAVPENVAKYKMQLIKEMGANGYRTSHYQQTAAYLDACDEMGILVMDEARWFSSSRESLEQLESLVKRDRNRPSVIFWSTSNEEPNHITDVGRRIHKAIAAHIQKFDYTRPITAAEDKSPEKSTIYDYCDVVGINYNLSIYDTVHEMCPDKPLFASECCATGTVRDWNLDTNAQGRVRDKDVETSAWYKGREQTYKFLRERDYVFGAFQWAAVEHRGEAAWPRVCSVSGALDLFLQKKGAFYQNQSHWTTEPMVHIVPHWNFKGLEGSEIPITVYTNCDELELFVNDESKGRKQIEKYGRGEWNVIYKPGTLTVKGYRDGTLAAEDTRRTTGKAAGLVLHLDNQCSANGRDLALFTCQCVDEKGNIVPDASETVSFFVSEPAAIIGTGSDHTDHITVASNTRKMYMGKISVAVKPAKGQKGIQLTAVSENCGIKVQTFELSE